MRSRGSSSGGSGREPASRARRERTPPEADHGDGGAVGGGLGNDAPRPRALPGCLAAHSRIPGHRRRLGGVSIEQRRDADAAGTPRRAAQTRQLDEHRERGDSRPAAEQCDGRAAVPPVARTSSTSRTRLPGPNGILLHLERRRAVLEVVGLGVHVAGQLALLAHRDEADTEVGREGGSEKNPRASTPTTGRRGPGRSTPARSQPSTKARRVRQQRRDVAEGDAGTGQSARPARGPSSRSAAARSNSVTLLALAAAASCGCWRWSVDTRRSSWPG